MSPAQHRTNSQFHCQKNAATKPHATLGLAHAHSSLHPASTFVAHSFVTTFGKPGLYVIHTCKLCPALYPVPLPRATLVLVVHTHPSLRPASLCTHMWQPCQHTPALHMSKGATERRPGIHSSLAKKNSRTQDVILHSPFHLPAQLGLHSNKVEWTRLRPSQHRAPNFSGPCSG